MSIGETPVYAGMSDLQIIGQGVTCKISELRLFHLPVINVLILSASYHLSIENLNYPVQKPEHELFYLP